MREIQHGTLQRRKRRRDGHGGSPKPSSDIDQRVYPVKDLAELLQDNLHQKVAVRSQGVVDRRVYSIVMLGHLPQGRAVHQGERALFVFIMPEPCGEPHAQRRVTEGAKHMV